MACAFFAIVNPALRFICLRRLPQDTAAVGARRKGGFGYGFVGASATIVLMFFLTLTGTSVKCLVRNVTLMRLLILAVVCYS